jgi:hypothetical protein
MNAEYIKIKSIFKGNGESAIEKRGNKITLQIREIDVFSF